MRPRSGQKRWCRPEAQARSRAVSLRSPFHSEWMPLFRRARVHGTGQAGSRRGATAEARVVYHDDAWAAIRGLLLRPYRGLPPLSIQVVRAFPAFLDHGFAARAKNGGPRWFQWSDASRACSQCEDGALSIGGRWRATRWSCGCAHPRANPHFTWRLARKRTLGGAGTWHSLYKPLAAAESRGWSMECAQGFSVPAHRQAGPPEGPTACSWIRRAAGGGP